MKKKQNVVRKFSEIHVCVCVCVCIMSFSSIYKNDFVDPKEFELCLAESEEARIIDDGEHFMANSMETRIEKGDCCSDPSNDNFNENYAHLMVDVTKLGTTELHNILNKDRMRSVYQIEFRQKPAYRYDRTQHHNSNGLDRVGPLLRMCTVRQSLSNAHQPNALQKTKLVCGPVEMKQSGWDQCKSSGNHNKLMFGLMKAIENVESE